MKTCTLEGAIHLIESGLRCSGNLDLTGPTLGLVVFAIGTIGAALLARWIVGG